MRQEFSFGGVHCDEHNAVFIAEGWPVAAPATPNKLALSGVHGTLRYKGKTYGEKLFSGTMYLLDPDDEIITYNEMLSRTTELARWLCADGRHPLVLDAMPDRYYLGEVEDEVTVQADEWGNGSLPLSFVLQPFTYALVESRATNTLAASTAKALTLHLPGNRPAPVGLTLTATGTSLAQVELTLGDRYMKLAGLGLKKNQALHVYHDLAIGEVMRVEIDGVSSLGKLDSTSTIPFEALPGPNTITVKASGAARIDLFARGRWL